MPPYPGPTCPSDTHPLSTWGLILCPQPFSSSQTLGLDLPFWLYSFLPIGEVLHS